MKNKAYIKLFSSLILTSLILFILPLFVGDYVVRVITLVYIYAVLASSWNIVGGFISYPSFGHVAFFGLGAYLTAILMEIFNLGREGLSFIGTIVMASIIVAIIAIVTGLPILRLRGHYFAIATWGFAEALGSLFLIIPEFGGVSGWNLPIIYVSELGFVKTYYYIFLMIFILSIIMIYLIITSRIGYVLTAIGDDEVAAKACGIQTTLFKICAYSISAFLAALIGGFYACYITYINTEMSFSILTTLEMIAMTLMGGRRTLVGPIIGAVLLILIREISWRHSLEWHFLITGLVIVFFVLVIPEGIWGFIKNKIIKHSEGQ
jgi:branched-chain amino acid transport system permease protein